MTEFLIVMALSIILMVVLIAKLDFDPVLALFIAALVAGVGMGYGVLGTVKLITSGFGGTMSGITVTIIFGCAIAECLRDTNALKVLVNAFIKLFKGKFLELPTALTAFVMSIPVFGDVTGILMAPITSVLAKRSKKSMSIMGLMVSMGGSLTHGVVPPTPGILAVALLCGANLGVVIGWSTLLTLITFFIIWFLMRGWVSKTWIEPREDFVIGIEPVDSDDYHDLLLTDSFMPPLFLGIMPLIAPILLIAIPSFLTLNMDETNPILPFLQAISDRNVAMFIGFVIACLVGFRYKDQVLANYNKNKNANETSIMTVMCGKWMANALVIALVPLLVTGMGGAFSKVIQSYPGLESMGEMIAQMNFPKAFVPFMISALLMIATGSRTTAAMTAAAICAPMIAQLGLSPEALTIIIGAGSLVGSHLNCSGFWANVVYYNFSVGQILKFITSSQSIAGVLITLMVIALNSVSIL